MKYYELKLTYPGIAEEERTGITIADLSDMGFESFQQDGNTLNSYIDEKNYKEYAAEIKEYIDHLAETVIDYELKELEDVDWNAVWESNFEPITVGDLCCVRAPFHPATKCRYEIIIMPKMSFGTGHHATTYLMIEKILEMNLEGKNGLDMGCGTGVLAILALKKGAEHTDAIDIDEWAYQNAIENADNNNVTGQISVFCGDAGLLQGKRYDFIFANINRNILLADMQAYADSLTPGGEILFSGFLEIDTESIRKKASECGLHPVEERKRGGWVLVRAVKS